MKLLAIFQSSFEELLMDATDLQILQILSCEGRATQESIAREVSLSRPAVHDRLRRLEEQGVIQGYRVVVDWAQLGYLTAFIWVRTSGGKLHDIAHEISKVHCIGGMVEECHLVTGDWCLLLKVRSRSTVTLQTLIDRLREMPRVRNTMTTLVLSSAGDTQNRQEVEQIGAASESSPVSSPDFSTLLRRS